MEDDDKGTGSALERFNQRIQESKEADADLDDDDAEGSSVDNDPPRIREDEETGDVEVSTSVRKQKKQERLRLRDELAATRATNEDLMQRLARIEGQQSVLVQQQTTQRSATEEDPLESELARIQADSLEAFRAYNAKPNKTQADVDAYNAKYRELEKKKLVIGARMANAADGIRPQDPNAGVRAMVRAQFGDVEAHPKALDYAQGEFMRLRAIGRPDTWETLESSMLAAREQFGLAPPRGAPPSPQRKQALSGPAFRRSAPQQDSDDGGSTIRMTKELRTMARSLYPGLPEKEAYQKWAQGAGRKFLAMQKNRG